MTKEIKPTYVTFEQAKLLKEKGFLIPTSLGYLSNGDLSAPYYGIKFINSDTENDVMYSAPEQHQVVEWLRVNHEIEVYALRYTFSKGEFVGKKYMFVVEKYKKNFNPDLDEYHFEEEPLESSRELNYNSPQEAYSAAFDYILNNLI
jgi:hypothetical protein